MVREAVTVLVVVGVELRDTVAVDRKPRRLHPWSDLNPKHGAPKFIFGCQKRHPRGLFFEVLKCYIFCSPHNHTPGHSFSPNSFLPAGGGGRSPSNLLKKSTL